VRKTDKPTGRGDMREQASVGRQPGRGDLSPRRQKESQGRGGRGGWGYGSPPRTMRRSTRLSDQQATKKQEELMMEEEDKTNNPFFILWMDEEEEVKDAEMEDKVDEMQVASPQRSPRRPAEKRIEREDASEGSMRRPSIRGKHEKEEMKKYQEGASEEEMTDAGGEIEAQPEIEGTQKEKEEEEDKSSGEKVSTDDEMGMEAWYNSVLVLTLQSGFLPTSPSTTSAVPPLSF
jgi:hypothetical protein